MLRQYRMRQMTALIGGRRYRPGELIELDEEAAAKHADVLEDAPAPPVEKPAPAPKSSVKPTAEKKPWMLPTTEDED